MVYTFKYLISIHRHQVKDYVNKKDIDTIVSTLTDKLPILKIKFHTYEISPKYKQLHYHALVESSLRVRYKDNSQIDGFRIYWSPRVT